MMRRSPVPTERKKEKLYKLTDRFLWSHSASRIRTKIRKARRDRQVPGRLALCVDNHDQKMMGKAKCISEEKPVEDISLGTPQGAKKPKKHSPLAAYERYSKNKNPADRDK